MKSGKVLIWTGVIVVVAIGGYALYASAQKKKEEAAATTRPRIDPANAVAIGAGVGALLSNLFKKKTVVANPALPGSHVVVGDDYLGEL